MSKDKVKTNLYKKDNIWHLDITADVVSKNKELISVVLNGEHKRLFRVVWDTSKTYLKTVSMLKKLDLHGWKVDLHG